MARNRKTENKGEPRDEADRPMDVPIGRGMRMTVRLRRQAPEQERRFQAAVDALLSELVRRERGRWGECNEPKGT
jgi:hypothetical protein